MRQSAARWFQRDIYRQAMPNDNTRTHTYNAHILRALHKQILPWNNKLRYRWKNTNAYIQIHRHRHGCAQRNIFRLNEIPIDTEFRFHWWVYFNILQLKHEFRVECRLYEERAKWIGSATGATKGDGFQLYTKWTMRSFYSENKHSQRE